MTATLLGQLHRQHTEYIAGSPDAAAWKRRYLEVRGAMTDMAGRLAREDTVIQTMPDVSPTKWHLGHVTWFFEQFLLVDGPTPTAAPDYDVFHDRFAYLFNSYYVSVGDRHCRIKRGTLSRPTLDEVLAYRRHVDAAMLALLDAADADDLKRIAPLLEIGINHEQQHLELAHTDIKHVFACNPLYPAYREQTLPRGERTPDTFLKLDGGLVEVGRDDGAGFTYDNERPRHKVWLEPYAIADRLVTNGEVVEFIEAGGYETASLWLSDGWALVNGDRKAWSQPFYWHQADDGSWKEFTLNGLVDLDPTSPATHLSYFEADAFARWRGCRLPTEAEWEHAATTLPTDDGGHLDGGALHPRPARKASAGTLRQAMGELWQWTKSQYDAYPGYVTPPGALGEYNGKFMCNQFVLRGSSCATQRSHARPSYRNFFPPDARWQFTGLRLARDGR